MKTTNQDFLRRTQHLSYEQAERRYFIGVLSARDWERFCRIWHWAAPLYSSAEQNAYYQRYGPQALVARINRLRRVLGLSLLETASTSTSQAAL